MNKLIAHFPDKHIETLKTTQINIALDQIHCGMAFRPGLFVYHIRKTDDALHCYLTKPWGKKLPKIVRVHLEPINRHNLSCSRNMPFSMYKKDKRCKLGNSVYIMKSYTKLSMEEYFNSSTQHQKYSCEI